MDLKRIIVTLLKIAGWTIGIWITLLILLQVVLSPSILTKVVNRYADEYLEADLKFGNAYVSVFERFPKVSLTLEDFSLTYPSDRFDAQERVGVQGYMTKAGSGDTADTLAAFRRFTVVLSTPALFSGTIRLPYVVLDKPRIFAHSYADGSANWNIFEAVESTDTVQTADTASGPASIPRISIGKIRFTDHPHIVYTDRRDTVFAMIDLKGVEFDGRIHTRRMSRNRLGLCLDSMFVAGRLKRDTLALGVDRLLIREDDGRMDIRTELKTFMATRSFGRLKVPVELEGSLYFPKDSVPAFRLEGLKAEIASIPVLADAHIRMMKDRTGIDADISINGCRIQGVMENFVKNFIPEAASITTDASLDLDIDIRGSYDHVSGRLPDIMAKVRIPESVSRHKAFDKDIRMAMEMVAQTGSQGEIDIRLDTIDVFSAGMGLSAKGSVSDLLGEDPAFNVSGTMKAAFDSLKAFLPDTLQVESHGTLTAGIEGSIRMSQANMYNFSKADLRGYIKGDTIVLRSKADTIDINVAGLDITLGPESRTSRRDSTKTFRLIGITGKMAKADISYRNALTAQGEEIYISARNSTSSDTTRINPLSGTFKAKALSLKDSESSRIRVRNTTNRFMLMPKRGHPDIPVMTLTSSNERIFMSTQANRAMVSGADIRVKAALNTVERRKKIAAFLDSLARVYPDIPRDSLFAHSRAQRASRPIPEWMQEKDFAKQDIDLRLDESMAKYFREWDIEGKLSVGKGFVMTPYLPLKNILNRFEGHFTNNEIGLDSLSLSLGNSELAAKGKLTGLRRALLRKGLIKADLDISTQKVDADQLFKAYQKGSQFNPGSLEVGEEVNDEEFLEIVTSDTTSFAAESSLIVVPSNVNADITLNASGVTYQSLIIDRMTAEMIMKERCVQITNTSASTNMGGIELDAFYSTRTKKDLKTGFSISFQDITAEKVIDLMPAVDSLMPMLKSFKGLLNCEVSATADLDTMMNIVMPSIDGVMRIGGEDLTISDSELYTSLAKKLMFKNKEEGRITSMNVEGLIRNSTLEVFPFVLKMDRYTLAMSGVQNLDQSFRYHASLIKSPFLVKLGVDLYGNNFDDMSFRIGKAKYRSEDVPVFSTVIDRTKVNLLQSIRGIFDKGVDKAIQENRSATAMQEFMKKIGYVRAVDQQLEGLSEEEEKQLNESETTKEATIQQ